MKNQKPVDKIQFRAYFPAIHTAFKRHGGGDGMRIQLDIPETDVMEAIALMALTQERLIVTVEVDYDDPPKTTDL